MKHCYFSLMLLFGAALLTGCSQDDMASGDEQPTNGVTMSVKDFVADNQTRTSLTLDESTGLKFKWSEGDDVCVFGPNDSQQILLTMIGGADVNTAYFSSDDYQLKAGVSYVAYYPYINNLKQEPKIPISYEGQTQTANNNYDHLSKYDFLVTDKTTPESTNNAHFDFNHMGAILRLKMEMPEAGTWQSVTLSAADEAFTTAATLDLFGETLIVPTTQSSSVTLNLNNIETTEANETLTAWLMLSPADFTSRTMTVTVKSANGGEDVVYQFNPCKNFEAGKAYSFTLKSGVQYVDLGLPSGTLWADRNLGANKMTDYGLYLPWGESTEITASNYGAYKGYWLYNTVGKYIDYQGSSDYDPAVILLDNGSVTPNQDDFAELVENTSLEWTTIDGVAGTKYTAENGNYIFLPAAGYRSMTTYKNVGEYACYWSSEFKVREYGSESVGAMFRSRESVLAEDLFDGHYWWAVPIRSVKK